MDASMLGQWKESHVEGQEGEMEVDKENINNQIGADEGFFGDADLFGGIGFD